MRDHDPESPIRSGKVERGELPTKKGGYFAKKEKSKPDEKNNTSDEIPGE